VRFEHTPSSLRRIAPAKGEHMREVLREAGFADAEIDAFVESGAVIGS
jgi:crotonobetainyl-CoA:carnitine CoA-transferase CaiB-like acyl-CoA transferase